MNVIIAFMSIIVMIVIHEWGHYIAGRICKVPIYEFAVGMGPVIAKTKAKNGTIFSVRAIPIGGFCAFDDGKDSAIQDSALNEIPIWQKIFICAMGPVINILTGFLIFLMLAIFIGMPSSSENIIEVLEGYPAYSILQEGDTVLEVNNEVLSQEFTLTDAVKKYAPNEIELLVQRGEETFLTKITPKYESGNYYVGVRTPAIFIKGNFIKTLKFSFDRTIYSIVSVYAGLFSLITNPNSLSEMSGLIGIISYMSEYATLATINSFLSIAAIISINLGIMNLLPIPGLDGSKILFGIFELCRGGKRISEKVEAKLIKVGFIILLGLLFMVTISDIAKLLF